jgi:ABC-type amino acid transport system permease subunit
LGLVVPLAPGRFDPQLLLTSSPFSDRALGGVLLVATRVALAVTALAVAVAAGSLVVRFRRAHGVERQQLRWVALAAAVMVLAMPIVLVPVVLESPILVDWASRGLGGGAAGGGGRGDPALSAL